MGGCEHSSRSAFHEVLTSEFELLVETCHTRSAGVRMPLVCLLAMIQMMVKYTTEGRGAAVCSFQVTSTI
jgi:hypothetical protein